MQASANIEPQRLRAALEKATTELLAERNAQGFWEGELSSSALATATAVTALAVALKHGGNPQSQILNPQSSIQTGLYWLAEHQNADGGWGDTTKSLSNISTTTLCWAAFGAAGADEKFTDTVEKAEAWLQNYIRSHLTFPSGNGEGNTAGRINIDALTRAIIARYGKDRTFSVPILTMCALAGRLGEGRVAWRQVIPLPFELAACPHQLFAALRLPVVSYALPALIAIGQARHLHAPSWNPLARLLRSATREKTLRKLTEIQPVNGGFLEATPLTSFVTMSLAGSGQAKHVVTQRGLEFLLKSQRADGSWPIDTNLSTWCSTLALGAIPQSQIPNPQSSISWLLAQQYTTEHPYTHAAPGGWAWTNLPGGVPDADDTAGALLALAKLEKAEGGRPKPEVRGAAEAGLRWLLGLQNRDGGIPTFCRGWGALPFDRSSADITAHALRAWLAWQPAFPELDERLFHAAARAVRFLERAQREDGSWVPLWFGNQHSPTEENPVYGTARVLAALRECAEARLNTKGPPRGRTLPTLAYQKGIEFLMAAQNRDGSWGHAADKTGSVEETGLALEALARVLQPGLVVGDVALVGAAVEQGARWLMRRVESGAWREPSPIGFYFAKLWYFERLYPMIFTVAALEAAEQSLSRNAA